MSSTTSTVKTILVIEDEEAIRLNLIDILTEIGYRVRAAATTEQAFREAFNEPPDLILCDIGLETRESGLNILEQIRRTSSTKNVPFIFLTANANADFMLRALRGKADNYLTKPYSRIELLNAIDKGLQQSEKPTKLIESSQPYLLLRSPGLPESGQRFDVTGYVMIGRSAECNARTQSDPHTSWIHAVVQRILDNEQGWSRISDGPIVSKPSEQTYSTNGIEIDGRRILETGTRGERIAILKGGETIRLSPRTWFSYHVPMSDRERSDDTASQ